MTPNRVNSSLLDHQGKLQKKNTQSLHFSNPWEKLPAMTPNGAGRCFPTNLDLANILGRTDLHSENCLFGIFWIPYFQIPGFQIQGCQLAWLAQGQGAILDGTPGPQNSGDPRN